MSDALDNLTLKQRRFVEVYLANGGNGVRAALAAYNTEDYDTANAIARENLQKPPIRAAIDDGLKEVAMGPSEILARLAEHARADMTDFIDDAGEVDIARAAAAGKLHLVRRISSKRQTRVSDKDETITEEVRVELQDQQGALDKLARIAGLYQDKLEVSGSLTLADAKAALAAKRGADKARAFEEAGDG